MRIAIDPGANGGIVCLLDTKKLLVDAMPNTHGDIVDLFTSYEELNEGVGSNLLPPLVTMEQVSGYIGKAQPGSAMFKFGENFGFLKGVIMAKKYRLNLVRPQDWQKGLGLGTSEGMTKTKWKNKLKAKAQELYPNVKVTLKTADALLIHEHSMKLNTALSLLMMRAKISTWYPAFQQIDTQSLAKQILKNEGIIDI